MGKGFFAGAGALAAALSLCWADGASAATYSPGLSGGEKMGKLIGARRKSGRAVS